MKKKVLATTLGASATALALALAPLAPASAATNSWGFWNLPLLTSPANTIDFTGTGMINASWSATGFADEAVLDTASEGEYFVAGTPIGAVFGANGPSADTNFLKLESQNDTTTPVVLTVSFDSAVPAGQLGFAVSDLDSDHVTITATDADDNDLTGAQIVGTATDVAFNFCNYADAPCTDTAVPGITTNANDVVAEGVESNTDGSTAWFMPSASVKEIVFTYLNDDGGNSSTARYWVAQTVPTLPETGVSSSATLGMVGMGVALMTAGALFVIRRQRKA